MSYSKPLYKATENGDVEFTEEEYAAYDARIAADKENAPNELAKLQRHKRNNLLAETDWMANQDVTMTDAMSNYRQALRDLPTHSNWPNLEDSDWPTKP
tara:strand:- start:1052 stop:1348 length:297 start_codon:yes stop_codon:yes gene_type:complete